MCINNDIYTFTLTLQRLILQTKKLTILQGVSCHYGIPIPYTEIAARHKLRETNTRSGRKPRRGEVSPEPEPVQFLPRTEASRNETRVDGCLSDGARVSDRSYVHTRFSRGKNFPSEAATRATNRDCVTFAGVCIMSIDHGEGLNDFSSGYFFGDRLKDLKPNFVEINIT